MRNLNQTIEHHYHRDGLFEMILAGLEARGLDLNHIIRTDLSGVDEFHVRGAQVSKELANYMDVTGSNILDVGCGIGGPCRMLAQEFNCDCTGIDLSREYIRTAAQLSKLVGLDDKTSFVHGNATALPFENGTFDIVWTQHVQMNIPDKRQFYSEIHRVLRPEGHLLYYDIFQAGKKDVQYPMPWASEADHSFLFSTKQMEEIVGEIGFSMVARMDQTIAGITFFETLLEKLRTEGPPTVGLNLLMGSSTHSKLSNLLKHLQDGALILQSGVYEK